MYLISVLCTFSKLNSLNDIELQSNMKANHTHDAKAKKVNGCQTPLPLV